MSGVICIAEGCDWFAANWLYEAILTDIKHHLEDGEIRAACELGSAPYVKFVDLRQWGRPQVEELLTASTKALATAEIRGPLGWRDPSFYPLFLSAFAELVQLLRQHAALA